MAISLYNLVDNLAEKLNKGKWKDYKVCLENVNAIYGLLIFKCSEYNKSYKK